MAVRGEEVVIRPYEPGDRSAVRRICFATGYMGEPEWQWRDAESFADLFSSYYTDAEPESILVAERAGAVEGYLLGCVDSRRAWRETDIFGGLLRRRLIALRPSTAGFVWRAFLDVAVDGVRRRLPPPAVHDERWPAHLHVNLLPAIRGGGVGGALLRSWLGRLDDLGVAGCHLQTLAENERAIAAFRSVGFRPEGPALPAPGRRSPAGGRHHLQLLVRPGVAAEWS
jgi:GNAT superfamily N-acetyltransferase